MLTETVYAFSSISGFDLLSCVLLVLVYFDTSSNSSMSLNSEHPCVFFLFTVINKSFRAGPSLSDVSCDSSLALSPEVSEPSSSSDTFSLFSSFSYGIKVVHHLLRLPLQFVP